MSERKPPQGSSAPLTRPPDDRAVERPEGRTVELADALSGGIASLGVGSGSVILQHLLETTRSKELRQRIRAIG